MASEHRYVRGRLVSYADLKLRIRGTNVVDDPIDFIGLTFDQKIERERPQGPGQGYAGKTSGSYTCSAKIKLRFASSSTLMGKLQAASPSGKICDMDFDVYGDFQWAGDDVMHSVEARDCTLDSDGVDAQSGNKSIDCEHDLCPRKVFKDGYCLIGED
jgi:hypothetical protein